MIRNLLILLALLIFLAPDSSAVRPEQPPAQETLSAVPGSNKKSLPFVCTAYDLSVESCGKPRSHPAYGITASGVSLKDKTHREAMAVAVDPRVISLGSKILVVFNDEKLNKYNGIYTAVDTGEAIKGNRLDIFIPDNAEALRFGRRTAKVYVL